MIQNQFALYVTLCIMDALKETIYLSEINSEEAEEEFEMCGQPLVAPNDSRFHDISTDNSDNEECKETTTIDAPCQTNLITDYMKQTPKIPALKRRRQEKLVPSMKRICNGLLPVSTEVTPLDNQLQLDTIPLTPAPKKRIIPPIFLPLDSNAGTIVPTLFSGGSDIIIQYGEEHGHANGDSEGPSLFTLLMELRNISL